MRNFHGQKTLTRLTTSFILTKLRHSNQRTDLKFLTSGTCQDTGSLEQISSESPMGSWNFWQILKIPLLICHKSKSKWELARRDCFKIKDFTSKGALHTFHSSFERKKNIKPFSWDFEIGSKSYEELLYSVSVNIWSAFIEFWITIPE